MKVKELIEELKTFDQELEIWVCDEIEGNDCPLKYIQASKRYDSQDGEEYNVGLMRW